MELYNIKDFKRGWVVGDFIPSLIRTKELRTDGVTMTTGKIILIGAGIAGVVLIGAYLIGRRDETVVETLPASSGNVQLPATDAAAEAIRALGNIGGTVAGAVATGEQRRLDREAEERRQRREDQLHERDRREVREDRAAGVNRDNR
jgi:hypothetical protein